MNRTAPLPSGPPPAEKAGKTSEPMAFWSRVEGEASLGELAGTRARKVRSTSLKPGRQRQVLAAGAELELLGQLMQGALPNVSCLIENSQTSLVSRWLQHVQRNSSNAFCVRSTSITLLPGTFRNGETEPCTCRKGTRCSSQTWHSAQSDPCPLSWCQQSHGAMHMVRGNRKCGDHHWRRTAVGRKRSLDERDRSAVVRSRK